MANPLYARLQATAERLIAKFGQVGAVRRSTQSGPSYDPVMTDTDYACQLVVMNYEDREVDGTLILSTDKKLYVSTAGLSITLERSDKIVADGVAFSIEKLKPLSPAGLIVFYEIQGRR